MHTRYKQQSHVRIKNRFVNMHTYEHWCSIPMMSFLSTCSGCEKEHQQIKILSTICGGPKIPRDCSVPNKCTKAAMSLSSYHSSLPVIPFHAFLPQKNAKDCDTVHQPHPTIKTLKAKAIPLEQHDQQLHSEPPDVFSLMDTAHDMHSI